MHIYIYIYIYMCVCVCVCVCVWGGDVLLVIECTRLIIHTSISLSVSAFLEMSFLFRCFPFSCHF